MTSPRFRALGGAACLLLWSCDAPQSGDPPPATQTTNIVLPSDIKMTPQADPPRKVDRDRASGSADQEPSMPRTDSTTTAPSRKGPVPAPPRRKILPSPIQPPAEVDPVHVDPGDEVPR